MNHTDGIRPSDQEGAVLRPAVRHADEQAPGQGIEPERKTMASASAYPWSDPKSDPLADINELARRAEEAYIAMVDHGAVDAALLKLCALTNDPVQQAKRIEHAAMLEAAGVSDELLLVLLKVAAKGSITNEDLAVIQRAGIAVRLKTRQMTPKTTSEHPYDRTMEDRA